LFGILVVPSQKRDAMKKAPPAQGHKALGIQIPGSEQLEQNETHQKAAFL